MRHDGGAGLAEAGDDVHDALGQAALLEEACELEEGEGCLLRGLDDHGAPRADGRSQLPGGHEQRVVPGDDLAGHPERLAQGQRHRVVGHGYHLAVELGGEAAVVLEAGGHVGEVVLRLHDGLAGVAGLDLGQPRQLVAHLLGEAEEDAAPLLGGGIAPAAVERHPRRLHGPVHVGGAGLGHLRDHRSGRGVEHLEGLPRAALRPLAADEHLVGLHEALLRSEPEFSPRQGYERQGSPSNPPKLGERIGPRVSPTPGQGGIFGGMRVKTSVTIERKVLRAVDRVVTRGRSRSRIIEEATVEFLARRARAAREARDLVILNREADALNREMEDVLGFQADV